jgi:hypothetical protein
MSNNKINKEITMKRMKTLFEKKKWKEYLQFWIEGKLRRKGERDQN